MPKAGHHNLPRIWGWKRLSISLTHISLKASLSGQDLTNSWGYLTIIFCLTLGGFALIVGLFFFNNFVQPSSQDIKWTNSPRLLISFTGLKYKSPVKKKTLLSSKSQLVRCWSSLLQLPSPIFTLLLNSPFFLIYGISVSSTWKTKIVSWSFDHEALRKPGDNIKEQEL